MASALEAWSLKYKRWVLGLGVWSLGFRVKGLKAFGGGGFKRAGFIRVVLVMLSSLRVLRCCPQHSHKLTWQADE